MTGQWIIHGGDMELAWLPDVLSQILPNVTFCIERDAVQLRQTLAMRTPKSASVLIGEGGPVYPLNLAAAIIADDSADEVMVVMEDPTDAVRALAHSHGISQVFSRRELERLGHGAQPATQEGSDPLPLESFAPPTGEPVVAGPESPAAGSGLSFPPPSGDPLSFEGSMMPQAHPTPPAGNVVIAPSGEGDLLDDLDDIFDDLSVHPAPEVAPVTATAISPLSGDHGPILTLVSGRGGVGKTTVAAAMAIAAASWGMAVALVDLDLSFGNLHHLFGLPAPADLTALSQTIRGDAVLRLGQEVSEGITVFGCCDQPEYAETVSPHVTQLLTVLASRFDLVVVDAGTGWGDGVAQAVQMSDRLLVTTDQRSGALGSMVRASNLALKLGVARTRIIRLMNRCDAKRRDSEFLLRAEQSFESNRGFSLTDGGSEVAELASAGTFPTLAGANPLAATTHGALAAILSELGALPATEAAQKALSGKSRGGRGRFGRRGD